MIMLPRSRTNVLLILLLTMMVAAMAAPSPLHAADEADPARTFDEVFGENYRKAIATPSTADDVELSRELAKAVATIEMPASLMWVIVERMTTLSGKASGALLPTVEAIDKLLTVEKDAGKKETLQTQAIALLEKASDSGDASAKSTAAGMLIDRLVPLADKQLADRKVEAAHTSYTKAMKLARDIQSPHLAAIAAKLQAADALLKDAREIDQLEKRLEANQKDSEARKRLIEIHLVKRDDPSAAIWFASEGVDEKTRKLLPIAAKDGANADAPTLAELAGWYNDLADAAAEGDKPAMYQRAKGYYEKFLAVHTKNDLLKAKATLSLDQINRKLKDLTTATAATPSTPKTTTTPEAAAGPGALIVEIKGPTITEPDRVERLFQQQWRLIAREFVALGGSYHRVTDFDSKFPSSAKESLAAVKARMTTTRIERDGLLRKTVTVPPIPAEAEAVAMGLPAITPGAWGYVHSVEVVEVVGEEEMIVKEFWMVDKATLLNVPWDQRRERDLLVRRQNDWNFAGNTMRLHGFPTAGLKPGERIGIGGKTNKPLQIYIIATEPQENVFKRVRPIATLTSTLLKGGLDEKQFNDLLTQNHLTRTDFVNIHLESQRASLRDAVSLTIARIQAGGAKSP